MICSCAPMFKFFYTPPDGASTEYQISNREFSDFLRTYYCDFLNNVYRQARFFSVVTMNNDKQVLPVSHWLEVVIAFVSSCYCYCYCVCACVQCARARVCVCDVRWLLFVFLCRLHIYSFLLFLSCCILNANKVYYIHRRLRLQGFYVAAAHANQKTAGIINNGARLPAVANLIICAFHRFHDVVRPSYYQSRSHCVLFTYLLIS